MLISPYDSVFGKRVLTYWEIRRDINNCHLNAPTVPIENYTFLERRDFLIFKNVWFAMVTKEMFVWL